jgi:hypothetical protein
MLPDFTWQHFGLNFRSHRSENNQERPALADSWAEFSLLNSVCWIA